MEEEARPTVAASKALDRMGVAELESYIAALHAEIARAEAQITAKQSGRSAADALFRFQ